jgi:uncharacterized protein YybS (DUF2232 family)
LDKIKKDDYSTVAVIFFAAAVFILLSAYMPIAALAAVFLLAYAVTMWGTLGVFMMALSFAAGCLLDVKLTAFLAAAFVPLILTIGFTIKKRLRMRHGVVITSSAALLGLAAAIGVLWLFTGLGPIDYMVSRFGQLLGTLSDALVQLVYQYVRLMDMITGAISQAAVFATPTHEAIAIIQDSLSEALNYYLVSGIICYSLLMGLLGFVITRTFVKKQRKVAPVPSFDALTLPPRFWLAYLISYLLAFAGISFGWPSFDTVFQTISGVYGFVFTVQALSFLDFLYKKRKMATAVRVLLHLVLTLLLGGILVWVGLFENISNLRKRIDTEGGIVS